MINDSKDIYADQLSVVDVRAQDCGGDTPSDNEPPLIICMHASVGSGHRSAASSTAEAFRNLRGKHPLVPENADVEVLDVLDFGFINFNGEKTTTLFTGMARWFYNFTWYHILTGRILWGGGTAWSYLMYAKFTDYVKKRKPLAIVTTHIVAANVALAARMVSRLDFPVVCVPTDYGLEGWWPSRYASLFCAADDLMVEELKTRRVTDDRIVVTGIPVRPDFNRSYDRSEVLKKYGLPEDKTVVLIIAGARVTQPYVPFRKTMDTVMDQLGQFSDMHFVFIPGTDVKYATYLRKRQEELQLDNVVIFDYVEKIAELMAASDLAVAKSGGLTITECLCAKLPLIIVGKAYGQERANTTTMLRAGTALQVDEGPDLIETLKDVQANPQQLPQMIENSTFLRKPDSARSVALATLDKVGKVGISKRPFMCYFWGKKPLRMR